MKLTVKMLFTCILRCDVGPFTALYGLCVGGQLLPGSSDISGNKVDEQVTEYSNLWFS